MRCTVVINNVCVILQITLLEFNNLEINDMILFKNFFLEFNSFFLKTFFLKFNQHVSVKLTGNLMVKTIALHV